jgi:hypothetical protein
LREYDLLFLLYVLVDFFEAFSMEKVENIALSSFVGKENNDVLLVSTHQLFFEATEDHKKAEHGALLGIVHITLFRGINNETQDF